MCSRPIPPTSTQIYGFHALDLAGAFISDHSLTHIGLVEEKIQEPEESNQHSPLSTMNKTQGRDAKFAQEIARVDLDVRLGSLVECQRDYVIAIVCSVLAPLISWANFVGS